MRNLPTFECFIVCTVLRRLKKKLQGLQTHNLVKQLEQASAVLRTIVRQKVLLLIIYYIHAVMQNICLLRLMSIITQKSYNDANVV